MHTKYGTLLIEYIRRIDSVVQNSCRVFTKVTYTTTRLRVGC
jgi:hypothetical protein